MGGLPSSKQAGYHFAPRSGRKIVETLALPRFWYLMTHISPIARPFLKCSRNLTILMNSVNVIFIFEVQHKQLFCVNY